MKRKGKITVLLSGLVLGTGMFLSQNQMLMANETFHTENITEIQSNPKKTCLKTKYGMPYFDLEVNLTARERALCPTGVIEVKIESCKDPQEENIYPGIENGLGFISEICSTSYSAQQDIQFEKIDDEEAECNKLAQSLYFGFGHSSDGDCVAHDGNDGRVDGTNTYSWGSIITPDEDGITHEQYAIGVNFQAYEPVTENGERIFYDNTSETDENGYTITDDGYVIAEAGTYRHVVTQNLIAGDGIVLDTKKYYVDVHKKIDGISYDGVQNSSYSLTIKCVDGDNESKTEFIRFDNDATKTHNVTFQTKLTDAMYGKNPTLILAVKGQGIPYYYSTSGPEEGSYYTERFSYWKNEFDPSEPLGTIAPANFTADDEERIINIPIESPDMTITLCGLTSKDIVYHYLKFDDESETVTAFEKKTSDDDSAAVKSQRAEYVDDQYIENAYQLTASDIEHPDAGLQDDMTVIYADELNSIPLTGMFIEYLPYLLLAGTGIVLLCIVSLKKGKLHD